MKSLITKKIVADAVASAENSCPPNEYRSFPIYNFEEITLKLKNEFQVENITEILIELDLFSATYMPCKFLFIKEFVFKAVYPDGYNQDGELIYTEAAYYFFKYLLSTLIPASHQIPDIEF